MSKQQSHAAKLGSDLWELDASAPSHERQQELRRASAKNLEAGVPPYANVEIWSLGELQWVMQEHEWSGEPGKFRGVRADLRSAGLSGINFSGVRLDRADLRGANLAMANLAGATLYDADLSGTILTQANLSGANLTAVKLSKDTALEMVIFDNHTRMADIDWNGVKLTQVDWELVGRLGDDNYADLRHPAQGLRLDTSTRLWRYQTAARANRQLALVLWEQGLNGHADRFYFRAQVMERKAAWREIWIPSKTWNTPFPWAVNKPRTIRRRGQKAAAYLIMQLLETMAGYGYRPGRAVGSYLFIISAFAGLYLINAQFAAPHLTWDEAVVLSISAFHGRGFFTSGISLGDTLARLAAGEAIIGLLIEITFIATFTQRFFAR